MPHGKVIHPLPIIRGAHAPDPAASWEASGVMEMRRRGRSMRDPLGASISQRIMGGFAK